MPCQRSCNRYMNDVMRHSSADLCSTFHCQGTIQTVLGLSAHAAEKFWELPIAYESVLLLCSMYLVFLTTRLNRDAFAACRIRTLYYCHHHQHATEPAALQCGCSGEER
jgi:hypothetical protein